MPNPLIATLVARRHAVSEQLQAITAAPATENRDLTQDEATQFSALDAEAIQLDQRIADLRAADDRDARAAEIRSQLGLADGPAAGPAARVRSEERTYARHRRDTSYFRDLSLAMVTQDPDAWARLRRHATEIQVEAAANPAGPEARALQSAVRPPDGEARVNPPMSTNPGVGSGNGGTFVPPLYLEQQYVPLARAARPFADQCTHMDLPAGTDSIVLPKVTSGSAVAAQATQNTAVAENDWLDAFVTAPVVTLSGQLTTSLQLLEQSPLNMDEVFFKDLILALETQVDTQCINGSGSAGTMLGVLNTSGVNSVTFTSGSPTLALLYSKLAGARSAIHKARFLPATHIWMTPDRFAWAMAQVDSQGRPLVVPIGGPTAAFNGMGVFDADVAQGPSGFIQGLPVFVDAVIPTNLGAGTNQDDVIVTRQDDLYLWEGATNARALPQTLGNQLSVLIQVYRYTAFQPARYPVSISVVGGTGLVAPAF